MPSAHRAARSHRRRRCAHVHRASMPSGTSSSSPESAVRPRRSHGRGHSARGRIRRCRCSRRRRPARGLTTIPALQAVLARLLDVARHPSRPGAAIDRLDARAESLLESLSRLRILESDLPQLRLQAEIHDSSGRWLARADFLWDDVGVVGEADGLEKYDAIETMPLRREKLRQELLERAGLIVVRWGWSDLTDPLPLIARIRDALARAARRPAADRGWTATKAGGWGGESTSPR